MLLSKLTQNNATVHSLAALTIQANEIEAIKGVPIMRHFFFSIWPKQKEKYRANYMGQFQHVAARGYPFYIYIGHLTYV